MRRSLFASAIAGALLACAPLLAHAKCNDPPAPKVDWHYCDKSGEKLESANLVGANLESANLDYARLWVGLQC